VCQKSPVVLSLGSVVVTINIVHVSDSIADIVKEKPFGFAASQVLISSARHVRQEQPAATAKSFPP